MSRTVGERVGAILGSVPATSGDTKGVVEFLGYGVYEGDHPVAPEAGGFNFGQDNPRIKLDNGKTVWGCECWWGGEARIKSEIEKYRNAGWEIQVIDIEEARKR